MRDNTLQYSAVKFLQEARISLKNAQDLARKMKDPYGEGTCAAALAAAYQCSIVDQRHVKKVRSK